MKLAKFTRNANLYSHKRLKEAAETRGLELDIIDTLRCTMNTASRKPYIYYIGERLQGYYAVIPRIGASITYYGLAVLRQMEMACVSSQRIRGDRAVARHAALDAASGP